MNAGFSDAMVFSSVGMAAVCLLMAWGLWNSKVLSISALYFYLQAHLNTALLSMPFDPRIVAFGFAFLCLVVRRKRLSWRTSFEGNLLMPASLCYAGIGLMMLGASTNIRVSAVTLIGLLAAVAFVAVLWAATEDEILLADDIRAAVLIALLSSLVVIFAFPSVGVEGARWRGALDNANSLGLLAGIYCVTSFRSKRSTWFSLPFGLGVLLGTASRASGLALGVAIVPALLSGRSRALRIAAGVIIVLAAVPVLNAVFFDPSDVQASRTGVYSGLVRTNDSRSETWSLAVSSINDNPVIGVGAGNQTDIVPSSLLRPLVEYGVIAVLPLILVISQSVKVLRGRDRPLRRLHTLLLVNALFEGWLFAGGSFFFVAFLLSGFGAERSPPGGRRPISKTPRRAMSDR